MRTNRWLILALSVLSLAFLIDLGARLFEDRRIALRTLMILNTARISFMHRLAPPYYSFQMGGASFIILDNGGLRSDLLAA